MLGFAKWFLLSAAMTLMALQSSGQDGRNFQTSSDQRQGKKDFPVNNTLSNEDGRVFSR